jgi:two-component system sensor histidine kinase MprB
MSSSSSDEMTTLVSELMELARGEQHVGEPEDVRLDLVAAGAVERTKRNRPGVEFKTDLEESLVYGVPRRSTGARQPARQRGQVEPADGEVGDRGARRRGHGPRPRAGIDEEDLPYVFDRFYRRAPPAGCPGSGLGLAIVRQVAQAHGGTVGRGRAEAAAR